MKHRIKYQGTLMLAGVSLLTVLFCACGAESEVTPVETVVMAQSTHSMSETSKPELSKQESSQNDVQESAGPGEESSELSTEPEEAKEVMIEDFPIILQMPELPTGCEITAMTMVLHYYGYDVDKTVMAREYLPTLKNTGLHQGEDGRPYGNNMYDYFVGDPFGYHGYICGTGAIITAADKYLEGQDSVFRTVDKTGIAWEELYRLVGDGIPVMVWVTVGLADRNVREGWYTEDGRYIDWGTEDHGAVLIGYTDEKVTLADPMSGETVYDRKRFEEVFELRSRQCVILTQRQNEDSNFSQ